jgi:hypothetical protein
MLSVFQPIGVVICSAIAYGFIPFHSCSPNFSESDPLPSCNNVASGVACCTRASNQGWRYLLFTLGAITLAIFFARVALFRFQESPKDLLYRGQDAKAVQVLQYVARFNKTESYLTLEQFEALQSDDDSSAASSRKKPVLGGGARQLKATWGEKIRLELIRYGMLFQGWPMIRLTLLVWLTYIMDFWGFTVAGQSPMCPCAFGRC